VHWVEIESVLATGCRYFPEQFWKFLRYDELQELIVLKSSLKDFSLLDSYFRGLGKRTCSVVFMLSRFIWGCISSRVSFKILFCVACLINIAAFIALMLTDSETTYLVFYTFNSASLGGLMVIFPNVTHLIFGQKLG